MIKLTFELILCKGSNRLHIQCICGSMYIIIIHPEVSILSQFSVVRHLCWAQRVSHNIGKVPSFYVSFNLCIEVLRVVVVAIYISFTMHVGFIRMDFVIIFRTAVVASTSTCSLFQFCRMIYKWSALGFMFKRIQIYASRFHFSGAKKIVFCFNKHVETQR